MSRIAPGPRNLITDVEGLRVGNAEDRAAATGATVVFPEERAVAGVHVMGGAPGTRETEALNPDCLVDKVDAVVLSGGSVFGLEAASGVANRLAAQGRGFAVAGFYMPIVPSAILFDMNNGGDKDWGEEPPYARLGREALAAAAADFALGNAGAGYGARAGRLKGGLGSCSAVAGDGLQVGALVAANPMGAVTMPDGKTFWAWALERQDEMGGAFPSGKPELTLDLPVESRLGGNTSIAVVATNAMLSKAQARRVAIMAHDGLARAIRPVHTPFDGDTVFALSTGRRPLAGSEEDEPFQLARIGALAADCVARAVARAVFNAKALGEFPAYGDKA